MAQRNLFLKISFMLFLNLIVTTVRSQVVYYDSQGNQTEKSTAIFYREYKLDKGGQKYAYSEFDLSGVKKEQGSSRKFDLSSVANQVLIGRNISYFNEGKIYKNYLNGMLSGDVLIYDSQSRLIRIIPTINGQTTEDDNLITYYNYVDKISANNYFTLKGHYEGEAFIGIVATRMNNDTATYYFNGQNLQDVFDMNNYFKPFMITSLLNEGLKSNKTMLFRDEFIKENPSWLIFQALWAANLSMPEYRIEGEKLRIENKKESVLFKLINPTPVGLRGNNFRIKFDVFDQYKCISGIKIFSESSFGVENQLRLGFNAEKRIVIIEETIGGKMINDDFVELDPFLIRRDNEIELQVNSNHLDVIVNGYTTYSMDNFKYYGDEVAIYQFGSQGSYSYYDNFKLNVDLSPDSTMQVVLDDFLGVKVLNVNLCDALKTRFILDTGASLMVISPEVFNSLKLEGKILQKDWLGAVRVGFANGTEQSLDTYNLSEIQIGEKKIFNVRCAVSTDSSAPLLLGQEALRKLGSYKIDNERNLLIIED